MKNQPKASVTDLEDRLEFAGWIIPEDTGPEFPPGDLNVDDPL